MLIESIAAVLLAYLLGMFPTAYVVSRLSAGVDIRRLGSENPGALNTYGRSAQKPA
jgi:glycerol-3-phosphate acyltransferase PlsY